MVSYATVVVGSELPIQDVVLKRANLVRYAGASGDFLTIYWNERSATSVGLPNVFAYGMLPLATAGRAVTDWVGDPSAVLEYRVRFSRPVVVPDDDKGALLTVAGTVESKLNRNRVVVGLTVTVEGGNVLSAARVVVQLI